MKRASVMVLLSVMAVAALPALTAPVVFILPRVDGNTANPRSGRVVARLDKGRFVRLSSTARCWNVKASPDGKSWAWIEGDSFELGRGEPGTLFPTRIVVWRNRAAKSGRATVIRPEKAYEVVFRWVNSDRIAVGSCGRHGAVHLQLFDARSGKCVERHMGYDEKLPAWAAAVNTL